MVFSQKRVLPFMWQILLASYQIYASLKHFMRRSF